MTESGKAESLSRSGSEGLEDVLSASDIERYGYCPLNWWQKKSGVQESSKNLEYGTIAHEKVAKDIKTITERESSATRSQLGMMWFAIIALLLGINGVAIIYFKYFANIQEVAFSTVLLVISILWIAIAIILFFYGLYKDIMKSRRLKETIKAAEKAEAGKVVIPDDAELSMELSGDLKKEKGRILNWRNVASWFVIIAMVLALSGYMLEYPFAPPEIQSRILLTAALLWLLGTSIALYFALRIEKRMKSIDVSEKKDQYLKFSQRYSRSEALVLIFAAGATILGIAGFVVKYNIFLTPLDLFGKIFLVLALVWMSAGFLFFYQSLWGGVKTQKISKDILKVLSMDVKRPKHMLRHIEAIETGKIMSEEYGILSMAVIATVLGINSILIRVESSDVFSRILEIVALIWLIGASFFLYDVLKQLQFAKRLREHYKLGKAGIEYADTMDEQTKLLVSKKYNIRGRPDLVLKKEGKIVPVEVKTGKVPRGPHFSHILQVAAYCLLIDENYNQKPPYGYIRYGKEKEFKIDYDQKLEKLLKEKITEMRVCLKTGDVHRNHNRRNKCKYCSRREGCPERLA